MKDMKGKFMPKKEKPKNKNKTNKQKKTTVIKEMLIDTKYHRLPISVLKINENNCIQKLLGYRQVRTL